MAYMSQDRKKELAPAIKAVLKKYKVKGSISVRHHSTLVVKIKSGEVDFAADMIPSEARPEWPGHADVNTYHIDRSYKGEAYNFLTELKGAMMVGNFDKSDLMSDYHHVGWYIDISIGGGYGGPGYQFTGTAPAREVRFFGEELVA